MALLIPFQQWKKTNKLNDIKVYTYMLHILCRRPHEWIMWHLLSCRIPQMIQRSVFFLFHVVTTNQQSYYDQHRHCDEKENGRNTCSDDYFIFINCYKIVKEIIFSTRYVCRVYTSLQGNQLLLKCACSQLAMTFDHVNNIICFQQFESWIPIYQ